MLAAAVETWTVKVVRALSWVAAAGVVVLPFVQPGGLLGPDLALASSALSVTGSVSGLQPGVPASLVLTVSNADSAPITVGQLDVEVTGGGTPTCPASSLRITPWRGLLEVPAGGSSSQALDVLLDPAAECGEVSWSLRYTAVPA